MKGLNSQNHGLNCLNHGLNGLKDCTDLRSIKSKNLCHLRNQNKSVIQTKSENFFKFNFGTDMKEVKCLNHGLKCQNHGLNGLKDCTDFRSKKSKNLCHLRNQNKSVIQTKSANILNSILELI
jgi:hypothetical protein